jgi:small GTP-binding protein
MQEKLAYYVNFYFIKDRLKLNENIMSTVTIGFIIETVKYKNIQFTIWDIGGQSKIRHLWKSYFHLANAVVFVLDSSDSKRINESTDELSQIVQEEELKDCVFLIFANKQDEKNVMSESELKEILKLNDIKQKWFLQPCSAHTGDGLFEGLDWLSKQLN